jgi:hypothetical protein
MIPAIIAAAKHSSPPLIPVLGVKRNVAVADQLLAAARRRYKYLGGRLLGTRIRIRSHDRMIRISPTATTTLTLIIPSSLNPN